MKSITLKITALAFAMALFSCNNNKSNAEEILEDVARLLLHLLVRNGIFQLEEDIIDGRLTFQNRKVGSRAGIIGREEELVIF